jgi:GBP family porin
VFGTAVLGTLPIAAAAQSSVVLYGVIDEGITFNSNQGGSQNWTAAANGMQATRWGLRAVEDLGGGIKALATLEGGFDPNSGAMGQGNRLFGRLAFVGLSNDIATITLGRQYDPIYDYVQPLSAPAITGTYGGHPLDNDNMEDNFRINNSVKVRSAVFGGFSGEAIYGFSNTAGGFNANSMWGVGGGYAKGPISIGAVAEKLSHPASNTNGAVGGSGGNTTSDYASLSTTFVTGAVQDQYIFTGAGTYKYNKAMVGLMYSHVLYQLSTTNVWFNNFEIDGSYQFQPDLLLSATYTFTDGGVQSTGANPKYHQLTSVLDYLLSKATDVYLQVSYQHAAGAAEYARIYPMAPSSTRNQTLARIALRHRF